MHVKTRDVFGMGLACAYDCERKLLDYGLPEMIVFCSSMALRGAFQQRLDQSHGHLARLERVFSMLGQGPTAENDDILGELLMGAKTLANRAANPAERDAALASGARRMEQYEIAMYASLVGYARQLGFTEALSQLEQSLADEKAAEAMLY